MTKMKSRQFCPTYAFIADMQSALTDSTRVVFAVVKGGHAALYDLLPVEICRTEEGDAKEFPLLAQNARNTKQLCRPTCQGDLPQFRTRLRDYGNHTTTPAVWRITHDPSIMQHQAQPRSYLPAPACHWRIHPAVPPHHPKLTQGSATTQAYLSSSISVWLPISLCGNPVPIQRLHHLTAR
jgi:hypothetical protein